MCKASIKNLEPQDWANHSDQTAAGWEFPHDGSIVRESPSRFSGNLHQLEPSKSSNWLPTTRFLSFLPSWRSMRSAANFWISTNKPPRISRSNAAKKMSERKSGCAEKTGRNVGNLQAFPKKGGETSQEFANLCVYRKSLCWLWIFELLFLRRDWCCFSRIPGDYSALMETAETTASRVCMFVFKHIHIYFYNFLYIYIYRQRSGSAPLPLQIRKTSHLRPWK